jgi:hypothetical protein
MRRTHIFLREGLNGRVPCISPYTNINSKWIKDLNIRPQTLKLIQERVGNTLELVGIG